MSQKHQKHRIRNVFVFCTQRLILGNELSTLKLFSNKMVCPLLARLLVIGDLLFNADADVTLVFFFDNNSL